MSQNDNQQLKLQEDTMARNRKYQSAAIRFGPILKTFLLCLLIGGSGVGYVWQKDQIFQLAREIRKRELRLADLADQNEKLRKQLATLRSPRFLEWRVQELGLGLAPLQPTQMWRLIEPAEDQPPLERKGQYAAPCEMNTRPRG